MLRRWSGVCALLAGCASMAFGGQPAALPHPLLHNGDFGRDADANGWPDGWPRVAGARWLAEGGNRLLRLQAARSGQSVSVGRSFPVQPAWGVVRVSCRARWRNIVRGPEGWHDGRIAMSWHNPQGTRVGEWPNVLHWTGTSDGWRTESRDYMIPEGATELRISLSLFSVVSGTLDLDDLHVIVLRERPRPADAPLPDAWKPALVPHWRQATATRERICLNGVWQFRPMGLGDDEPRQVTPALLKTPPPFPRSPGWGWTKVPATWPGRYVEAHEPAGPDFWALEMTPRKWGETQACWYRRTVSIPANWAGRRILLAFDMPQTQVAVLAGDKLLGHVRWPGGELDITAAATPAKPLPLTLFVTALPFASERLVAMREDIILKAKASVRFRGLCGDVFLRSEPVGPRIGHVQFRPSVRRKRLGLRLELAGAPRQKLRVRFESRFGKVRETEWTSKPSPAIDGVIDVTVPWLAKRLWDLDAPNLYDVRLALLGADGKLLDEVRERLGFREVWLDGRDIVLNGTRIHWRALNFSNHTRHFATAGTAQCKATFGRMRALGFNFVILGNYNVDPGGTASFGGLLDAADEMGFLLSFTLPHPLRSLAGWNARRGTSPAWQRIADYCIRKAQNRPCVLAYAMTHNTLGYRGDQNPMKLGVGPAPDRPDKRFRERRATAAAAETYVRRRDPTRLLYHHQSGTMGRWHTVNCYLNWAPIQERMEWLSHWAARGVRPLFFVEWGCPHQASWGGHRVGPFIWRNKVNSQPLAVEFAAAITGDRAYDLTEADERHIDRYERVYARGEPFHISSVLGDYWGEAREHNFLEIKSAFTARVWPAFRTWGISAILPWDQADVGRYRPGSPARVEVEEPAARWAEPGIHPDFVPVRAGYWQTADPSAYELTSFGKTFQRLNQDVLLWIAGKPGHFTEQSHIFRPGETVTKQVVAINDRRTTLRATCLTTVRAGTREIASLRTPVAVPPGGQQRIPIQLTAPAISVGECRIESQLRLPDGAVLRDSFVLGVIGEGKPAPQLNGVVLWDPKGLTTKELRRLGVRVPAIDKDIPSTARALIIGREALTVDGAFPDIAPLLARGGRVVIFEQAEQVLSRRLGFRTNVPSLRRVFDRACASMARPSPLRDLGNECLRDWRGKATLIPERHELPDYEPTDPMVDWLGFRNTRVWKWGNTGQVASIAVEKPQRGDFTPILDGGFDLQYAPLLEMATPAHGRVVFCQMDVTGRTEPEPAAELVVCDLLHWASQAAAPGVEPRAAKQPGYFIGDPDTRQFLRSLGARLTHAQALPKGGPGPDRPVLFGPMSNADGLRALLPAIAANRGLYVFLWQPREVLEAFGKAIEVETRPVTHIRSNKLVRALLPLWGVGPAELHFRGRTPLDLVFTPDEKRLRDVLQTGVVNIAKHGESSVIFCQLDPRCFGYTKPNKSYLKLTHNRTRTMLSRLLANCGVPFDTPLLDYWRTPPAESLDLGQAKWLGAADPKKVATPDDVLRGPSPKLTWHPIAVPGRWEEQHADWRDYTADFWYRCEFDSPAALANRDDVDLVMGAVDDEDWTYLNGTLLGHIGTETHPKNYWAAERRYRVPKGLLKPGRNVLVVKVRDLRQSAGIVKGPVALSVPPRWLRSYYLDTPVAKDDPYRYERW